MLSTAEAPSDQLRELYRELILDHARHPRHFGRPSTVDRETEGVNPLCGDRLTVFLCLDGDRIAEAAFEGTGCAISRASASLMTEAVTGSSKADALALSRRVRGMLRGEEAAVTTGKLEALAGVREFPSRVKCASLAWHALTAALDGHRSRVSTE